MLGGSDSSKLEQRPLRPLLSVQIAERSNTKQCILHQRPTPSHNNPPMDRPRDQRIYISRLPTSLTRPLISQATCPTTLCPLPRTCVIRRSIEGRQPPCRSQQSHQSSSSICRQPPIFSSADDRGQPTEPWVSRSLLDLSYGPDLY